MKCTVKFKLNQVACPGTLHLSDRNPVFLSIYLFGRYHRTQHVYPSFPMTFNSKLKFQRIFTNAKTPEQVLEILEDESILIELRQHTKGYKGGHVLAVYEESARKFLYPSPSYIPREDHLKREILLTRTKHFSNGRGLDPQLTFRTKTYIEEAPSVILTTPNFTISKQFPTKAHSATVSHAGASSARRKKCSKKKNIHHSLPLPANLEFDESCDSHNTKEIGTQVYPRSPNTGQPVYRHCICDCPTLRDRDFDLDDWIQSLSVKHKEESSRRKPFRTGRASNELIAKREFVSPSNKEVRSYNEALCKQCLVPSKKCVLCNAYKTVYGDQSFLQHRFDRYHKDLTINRCKPRTQSPSRYGYTSKVSPTQVRKCSPYTDTNKIPIGTPLRKEHDESSSDEEDDWWKNYKSRRFQSAPKARPRPLPNEHLTPDVDIIGRRVTSPTLRSRIFTPKEESYTAKNAKEEAYSIESARIHQRIKDLMKKNNSVLQHDLSSSESITDDDDYYEDIEAVVEPSLTGSRFLNKTSPSGNSSRRKMPTKSVVTPVGGGKYWSSESIHRRDDLNHRDVLDSSLKAIYQDLYEKTLKNK
ncbi:uncharacterized protein LOC130630604 [Hydractinia symbiolongicarpus]|uniref:uncharacterized protein LOC130630604 n=1 Tax=Hydractinia symbiolongicarpus TaxID=13093 RepID=UPI00254FB559|nr:uncharacterized protein LOC130630604 [Hydractinia symbiolongicarpus]